MAAPAVDPLAAYQTRKADFDAQVRAFIATVKTPPLLPTGEQPSDCPLSFWKRHGSRLNLLEPLMPPIFAASGGSHGPEAVWSAADFVIGDRRTSLTGPRVDKLVRNFMRVRQQLRHALEHAEAKGLAPQPPRWKKGSFDATSGQFFSPAAEVEDDGDEGLDDLKPKEAAGSQGADDDYSAYQ